MTDQTTEPAVIPGATRLTEELARNPYAVMGGAFGVGFVLGGGLFTRLTARLVGAGVRAAIAAALPTVVEEVLAVANRERTAARDGGGPAAVDPPP